MQEYPIQTDEELLCHCWQIFMRMGFPRLLTSDQGGEFKSDLDREMMKILGIKHHFTTPYHPQVMFMQCMSLVLINHWLVRLMG